MQIRDATPADDADLIALWRACGLTRAWNDPTRDLARARSQPTTRIYCGTVDDRLMASAIVGYDGHRGWLYYLAVAPEHRGRGHGHALIARAETDLLALGCPKLMMMVRGGQAALESWYAAQGYTTNPVTVLGKRLIADDDPADQR